MVSPAIRLKRQLARHSETDIVTISRTAFIQ
jgi:hypothetical protein